MFLFSAKTPKGGLGLYTQKAKTLSDVMVHHWFVHTS